jgi:hypothetical protein
MKTFWRWFAILTSAEGWRYLREKPHNKSWSWTVAFCRLKGHPNGVWWYNVGGFEPDNHCKDCGEDIG